MADVTPFFLTGSKAKIYVDNKLVALATDVSYNISVKHATPRVLGRFEAEVVQPLEYIVTGSLTIIKYAQGLKNYISGTGNTVPPGVSNDGNGVGGGKKNGLEVISKALGIPEAGKFPGGSEENFIPRRFFQSKMFDIEVRQRLTNVEDVPVIRLRECRFTELQFSMNKKGPGIQTMRFTARYADEDTFYAAKSGVGQELS